MEFVRDLLRAQVRADRQFADLDLTFDIENDPLY